ncbi:MAG: amidase [Anaerolineales bacterium]|nr:amidase [Anaerolineales bacterium]
MVLQMGVQTSKLLTLRFLANGRFPTTISHMSNLPPHEIDGLDALALAELVRRKEVTALELVETVIDRIEAVNPELNAVVTPMFEQARTAANGVLPEGPLAGVPFLLKESTAAAGVRHSSGARVLADFVAEQDSEMVARYKAAGLIPVGKTNMSEFGLLPTTESQLFGPCRNPWDVTRTPGGSSGGSAAAVATGIVPAAHGADGGGSIRIPASCCGLFGLKPTRARTPKGPAVGDSIGGLVIDHVISRTVRDSAALLDVTAGPAVGDPYWAPPQERPFLDEAGTPPGKLRIAFSTEAVNGTPVHSDCVAAVRETAVLCEQLGHYVAEAAPAIDAEPFINAFTLMWAAGCAWGVKGIAHQSGVAPTAAMYEPVTWGLHELSQQHTPADYLLAVQVLQGISRHVAAFMRDYDLLLTPTLAQPPLPLGSFAHTEDNPMAGFETAVAFAAFTPIANATGQPSMSVPLYWNSDNLPIGVQFTGCFGDEATLFRLAGQLEMERPWRINLLV